MVPPKRSALRTGAKRARSVVVRVCRSCSTSAATRRQRLRWVLFLLLPLALVAGTDLYAAGGRYVVSDDSYIEADKVALSTDVSGIVKEIEVHDNQKVAAGDVLFRLDDEQYRIALQRAEAQLGTVRNTINALKASYRDMQAQQRQAQADIDYYSREFQRQQDLVGRQVTSQSSFDAALSWDRTGIFVRRIFWSPLGSCC